MPTHIYCVDRDYWVVVSSEPNPTGQSKSTFDVVSVKGTHLHEILKAVHTSAPIKSQHTRASRPSPRGLSRVGLRDAQCPTIPNLLWPPLHHFPVPLTNIGRRRLVGPSSDIHGRSDEICDFSVSTYHSRPRGDQARTTAPEIPQLHGRGGD